MVRRLLGSAPAGSLPCPSDADPGAEDGDEETSFMLEMVRSAIEYLQCAEEELLRPEPDLSVVDKHIDDAVSELGVAP